MPLVELPIDVFGPVVRLIGPDGSVNPPKLFACLGRSLVLQARDVCPPRQADTQLQWFEITGTQETLVGEGPEFTVSSPDQPSPRTFKVVYTVPGIEQPDQKQVTVSFVGIRELSPPPATTVKLNNPITVAAFATDPEFPGSRIRLVVDTSFLGIQLPYKFSPDTISAGQRSRTLVFTTLLGQNFHQVGVAGACIPQLELPGRIETAFSQIQRMIFDVVP